MESTNGSVLLDFFENHQHRLIHKWMHYFEIYERHFHTFRGKPMSLLEFGVLHGGSLQMWKHYFGAEAQITGVDIDPKCGALTEERIDVIVADQENRDSLRAICQTKPKFDIIIDDGGHTMLQQRVTFEEMWSHLKDGGVYLCEDLLTSYWPGFGGGYRKADTFVEYTKNMIDQLHAWHSREPQLQVNDFTRSAFAVHYYDSVIVIEKRAMLPPRERMRGTPSFALSPAAQALYDRSNP